MLKEVNLKVYIDSQLQVFNRTAYETNFWLNIKILLIMEFLL